MWNEPPGTPKVRFPKGRRAVNEGGENKLKREQKKTGREDTATARGAVLEDCQTSHEKSERRSEVKKEG